MPSVDDDSGWFTSNPSGIQVTTTTPIKGIEIERANGEDISAKCAGLLEVHHMRGLTSSTEVKQVQPRHLHLMVEPTDETENVEPIIKRVPDSGISQKRNTKQKGRVRQFMLGAQPGYDKNNTNASEPVSEMTDDVFGTSGNVLIAQQSLESLQSNASTASLNKNAFSKSQKITNIAARYIKENAMAAKNGFAQNNMQSIEKGTPRFSRQQQKIGVDKKKLRKKKSVEIGSNNDSFEQIARAGSSREVTTPLAGPLVNQQTSVRHQAPYQHFKMKKNLGILADDQLSNTQQEEQNSVSSLSASQQQKEVKSLIGLISRQAAKATGSALNTNSNNAKLNRSNLSQHNIKQKTKFQLSKLSDNLYPGGSTSQSNNGCVGTVPLTPNSTGNATMQGTGFGSGNSQQSRSFNIGLQQSIQSGNSKKKLAAAKPNAISTWKNQNSMIKNTLNKALQHHRQAAPQTIKTMTHQLPEPHIVATKVAVKSGGGSGAQSHREKTGLQMLLNTNNQIKQVEQQNKSQISQGATTKKKSSNRQSKGNQKGIVSGNNESQRQRLFQKQLSQTIKLTGISSGISPKASGDYPVELAGEYHGSSTFFKLNAAKTTTLQKALKSDLESHMVMRGSQNRDRQMTIEEPSEVRDSFVIIGQQMDEQIAAMTKGESLERKQNQTPANVRLIQEVSMALSRKGPLATDRTQIEKDFNEEEEGLGPLPTSPKHNRLSTLPSVNTLKQIETLKLAIREEKASNRHIQANKQQLLSQQKIPLTQTSNMMPMHLRMRTSSPPHSPVNEQVFANWYQADGQPFQLYQSRPQGQRAGEVELDEGEGEEENISEMMHTILQSTHRSAQQHPVAQFNESHPTQQIQGMSQMRAQQQLHAYDKQRNIIQQSRNSPGHRMESAQLSRASAGIKPTVNDWLSAAQTYQLMNRPDEENKFLPQDLLLRAESIQSMSNVIDLETSYRINDIHRGDANAAVVRSKPRAQLGNHFQQPNLSQKHRETRKLVYSKTAMGWCQQEKYKKRNILVTMLQDRLLNIVMQYLAINHALSLQTLLSEKPLKGRDDLVALFEREFLTYLTSYRMNDPSCGGDSSGLCRLITGYYLSSLEILPLEATTFTRVRSQLRRGRVTIKQAQDEGGVGFEIEKDVERTFLDQSKFTELHRHGLSIVLRAIAHVEEDIGYVQGLNFIVGNLLMQMEHRLPTESRRATLVVFCTLVRRLGIREFYTEKLLGLKEAIFKLECLLYNEMPEVFLFLMEMNISVEYFASQWFLTLFQYDIEDVEQSALIMLLALTFGQKIIYQIAFQLMVKIRSKLCLMSFEKALTYLKDFASKPQYRTSAFLAEAMQNDRISNQLLDRLGKIYHKMCDKQLNRAERINQTPIAMRVKFLRGTQPGKVNIKVIWGSNSQQDLMSNSNSLASIQNFQILSNPLSPVDDASVNTKKRRMSEEDPDNDSLQHIVIEDIPEVMNSNRNNNLSHKMHNIFNQSIEQKRKQMGDSAFIMTDSNMNSPQTLKNTQRTFLQPSKTIIDDLTMDAESSPAYKRQIRQMHQHPQALLKQTKESINPFDTQGGDNGVVNQPSAARVYLRSFDNSIELLQPVTATSSMLLEEGVASEDVNEGDESGSTHNYFGNNKELFEHTQKKGQDSNLHRYQEESTFELSRVDNTDGTVAQAQRVNPTRSRGLSYHRTNKPLMAGGAMLQQQPMIGDLMMIQRKTSRQELMTEPPQLFNQQAILSNHRQQLAQELKFEDLSNEKMSRNRGLQVKMEDGVADTIIESDLHTSTVNFPQMLQSSASSKDVHAARQTHQRRPDNAGFSSKPKGGSLSPEKQQQRLNEMQASAGGFSHLFWKLKPHAAQLVRRQEISMNSSDESAQLDERLAVGGAHEHLARPKSYRAQFNDGNKNEDDLMVSNETSGREPPLFMSPQTAYRKQQQKQQQQKQVFHHPTGSVILNNEYSQHSPHRSPRAYQPTLQQPGSGRHRKTVTAKFDSRAMHYPDGTSSSHLAQKEESSMSLNKSSSKKPKPTEKQKKCFVSLNLERLNNMQMAPQSSQVSSGRVSRVVAKKQAVSRPQDSSNSVDERKHHLVLHPNQHQPSENIPESEQKEQKVNNISLYGSTNPNNLKMTKKRQDFQQYQQEEGETELRNDSPQNILQSTIRSPGGVDWDEDDILVRSYRLPKIPVTKQTGLLSKKNHGRNKNHHHQTTKDKMSKGKATSSRAGITNGPIVATKASCTDDSDSNQVGAEAAVHMMYQHGSQENILRKVKRHKQHKRTVQRYQQDILHSKDKKLMGQLNQSLEESKGSIKDGGQRSNRRNKPLDRSLSQNSADFRVLKESKSHDRSTMLSRLTASGMIAPSGVSRLRDQSCNQNRQRLFNMAIGPSVVSGQQRLLSQNSQEAHDLENLQEVEEDNFADGRIPEANISNYNSHQSHNKKLIAFQRHERGILSYGSNGSNALEETCIIKHGHNLFLRQELRNSKVVTLNDSQESGNGGQNLKSSFSQTQQSVGAAFGPKASEDPTKKQSLLKHIQATAKAAVTGSGQSRQTMSKIYHGKTSVQRQSMQVQGHMGDKLYEDQAL